MPVFTGLFDTYAHASEAVSTGSGGRRPHVCAAIATIAITSAIATARPTIAPTTR